MSEYLYHQIFQTDSTTDFNGFQFGTNLRLDGFMDALTDITFFHGKC